MRYKRAAKNRPTNTRHIDAPNGSSTTLFNPPCANLALMPSTVSAPNQVANVVVIIITSGKLLPASAKSVAVFTRVPAYRPMASVPSRYSTTKPNSAVMCLSFLLRRYGRVPPILEPSLNQIAK